MAENSKISWTDHTFNPWIGCTKIGPGCDNCYAATQNTYRKWVPAWGDGNRRRTSVQNWNKPLRWNKEAEKKGIKYKVFCASLADVFDNTIPQEWRDDLWALIRATPFLEWQIVTKRIGNAKDTLPADWGDGYPNVWLIITTVTQEEFDRDFPKLKALPVAIRGISMEPQLERISDIDPAVDWIITGGESGAGARPYCLSWAWSLIIYGKAIGAAVFVKQLGSNPIDHKFTGKADDPEEWPKDLRVQEFPK